MHDDMPEEGVLRVVNPVFSAGDTILFVNEARANVVFKNSRGPSEWPKVAAVKQFLSRHLPGSHFILKIPNVTVTDLGIHVTEAERPVRFAWDLPRLRHVTARFNQEVLLTSPTFRLVPVVYSIEYYAASVLMVQDHADILTWELTCVHT